MSRIAAEELPRPTSGAPVWGSTAQAAQYLVAASPGRPAGRRGLGLALAGGLAVLAIGALVYRGVSKDDGTTVASGKGTGNTTVTATATAATVVGDGAAGNSALTAAELDAAYTAVFGVRGDAATLGCLGGQIGVEGGQAARLAHGEMLDFEEARTAFMPFVTCAPDDDFLAGMVPLTMQLFNQQADQTCIEGDLAAFGDADRAEALALALTDPNLFAGRLVDHFQPCAF
jgi:hypothetical protein